MSNSDEHAKWLDTQNNLNGPVPNLNIIPTDYTTAVNLEAAKSRAAALTESPSPSTSVSYSSLPASDVGSSSSHSSGQEQDCVPVTVSNPTPPVPDEELERCLRIHSKGGVIPMDAALTLGQHAKFQRTLPPEDRSVLSPGDPSVLPKGSTGEQARIKRANISSSPHTAVLKPKRTYSGPLKVKAKPHGVLTIEYPNDSRDVPVLKVTIKNTSAYDMYNLRINVFAGNSQDVAREQGEKHTRIMDWQKFAFDEQELHAKSSITMYIISPIAGYDEDGQVMCPERCLVRSVSGKYKQSNRPFGAKQFNDKIYKMGELFGKGKERISALANDAQEVSLLSLRGKGWRPHKNIKTLFTNAMKIIVKYTPKLVLKRPAPDVSDQNKYDRR